MLSGKQEGVLSPEERIVQHRKDIEQIRDQIAWLRDHKFRLDPYRDGNPGMSTEELIAQHERTIEMYEVFVAQLQEKIDNA